MYVENVVIVGSGGREHAIGSKLAGDGLNVSFAPGNGGTSEIGQNLDMGPDDFDRLLRFASDEDALIVVGPEQPLVDGFVDDAREEHVLVFGPTELAAKLEGSKAWAAQFMNTYGIPQPRYNIAYSLSQARQYIEIHDPNSYVIKADGLAGGKGVILPKSLQEAEETIVAMMVDRVLKDAGDIIVFQERLHGPEVSVLAFTDGKTVVPLLPAQDHKRAFKNDEGPNTGGMGAYAPAHILTPELQTQIHETILQPTIDGMRAEGHPYKGVLYAGLMLTAMGPQVLEYNVRFGDPETQPLLTLLSSELAPIMINCINGNVSRNQVRFRGGAAACVVLASEGYPGKPQKGQIIYGLDKVNDPHVQVFHAGTALVDGDIVVSGGRVLGITAHGKDLQEAIRRAYAVIGPHGIHFDGMFFRDDIGARELNISEKSF